MAEEYIGYCVKCKNKQTMQGAQIVPIKGKGGKDRRAASGTCPVCGTKMFKILGNAAPKE